MRQRLSSSSWHPRPVPSGAKVYRRRIPPPIAETSSPKFPQESTGAPRHSSSEPGFGIPILAGPSSDSIYFHYLCFMAQYKKQFPPLQTPCTNSIRRSDRIKTKT